MEKMQFKIEPYPSLGIQIKRYSDNNPDEILDIKTDKIIYTCNQGEKIGDVFSNGTILLENEKKEVYHLIKLERDNKKTNVKVLYENYIAIETCAFCPRLFMLVYKKRGVNTYLSLLGDENGNIYSEDGNQISFESDGIPIDFNAKAIEVMLFTPNKNRYIRDIDQYIFYCDKTTGSERLLVPVSKSHICGETKYETQGSLLKDEFVVLHRKAETYVFSKYELICKEGKINGFEYADIEELERGENDEYRIYFTWKGYNSSIIKVYKDGTSEFIAKPNMQWQYDMDKNNIADEEQVKYNYPYVIYQKEWTNYDEFGVVKVDKDEKGHHKLVLIAGFEEGNYKSIEIKKGQIKGTDCILFTTKEPSTQILLHESTGKKLEYIQITVKDNFVIATNGDGYDVYFVGPNGIKILGESLTNVDVLTHTRFNEQLLVMEQIDELDNIKRKVITRRLEYPKKDKTA